MIDNYEQAMLLVEKMKQHLPIPIQSTPELLKLMNEQQGNKYSRHHVFEVESILYSGDSGGITCAIKSGSEDKVVFVVSLTHLRIADEHPLSEEIKSYQHQRVIRLAIANGKQGQAKRLAKKNRKKKGFD